MTNVNIKFARLHNDTIIPSKRSEDAGLDIYARFDDLYMIIPPHTTAMVPTMHGEAMFLPWVVRSMAIVFMVITLILR